MSVAFLKSLLTAQVENINSTNRNDANEAVKLIKPVSVADIANKSKFEAINNQKLSALQFNAKKSLQAFKDFEEKYNDKGFTKIKLDNDELTSLKNAVIKNLDGITEDNYLVALGKYDKLTRSEYVTAIESAISDCTSVPELANPIALTKKILRGHAEIKDYGTKVILGKIIEEPLAIAIVQSIQSKYLSILAELANVISVKDKGKLTSEEAAAKLLDKITGGTADLATTKVLNELIDGAKHAKARLSDMEAVTIDKVSKRFKISEKEIRNSYETSSHILDLDAYFKELRGDLKVYLENYSSDTDSDRYSTIKDFSASYKTNEEKLSAVIDFVKLFTIEEFERSMHKLIVHSCFLNESKTQILITNIDKSSTITEQELKSIYKYNSSGAMSVDSEKLLKKNLKLINSTYPWEQVKKLVIQANRAKDSPELHKRLGIKSNSNLSNFLKSIQFQAGHINPVISYSSQLYVIRRALKAGINKPAVNEALSAYSSILEAEKDDPQAKAEVQKLFKQVLGTSFTQELANKLTDEFIYAEAQFSKISDNGELRAKLQVQFDVFTKNNPNEANFPVVMRMLQEAGTALVGVKLETNILNEWFGSALQKKYVDAKNAYIGRLIKKIEASQNKGKNTASIPGPNGKLIQITDVEGSPSLRKLLELNLYENLKDGKVKRRSSNTSVKVKSSGTKPRVISTQRLLILPKKAKSSAKIRPVKFNNIPSSSNTVITSKQSIKKSSKSDIIKIAPTGKKPAAQLRGTSGKFVSPTNIKNLINTRLADVIKSKMGIGGTLVNRTGRFAASAQVTSVMQANNNDVAINYTYMKAPYQTFEQGFRQGSQGKDPRALIGSSIREIVKNQVLGRLRITRS